MNGMVNHDKAVDKWVKHPQIFSINGLGRYTFSPKINTLTASSL